MAGVLLVVKYLTPQCLISSTSRQCSLILLAFTGLVFIFMIFVVSPKLFLGLVGAIGAWLAWRKGDTGAKTSGRKIRRMKVYIKRTHNGQCVENNQEAGLNRAAQLERRIYNM